MRPPAVGTRRYPETNISCDPKNLAFFICEPYSSAKVKKKLPDYSSYLINNEKIPLYDENDTFV